VTDQPARSLPVDPPVHVETFPSHHSLTWSADGLDRFLRALEADPSVPGDATAIVDASDVAGRQELPLGAVDAGEATTYVRVEPPAPWTLAWERRTVPTVSLTGTPAPRTVQRLHVATTDSEGWTGEATEAARRLLDG
jgi:hypothetical protein